MSDSKEGAESEDVAADVGVQNGEYQGAASQLQQSLYH